MADEQKNEEEDLITNQGLHAEILEIAEKASEKLFRLTVTVVSNVLPPTDARYNISSLSETGRERWRSKLLSEEEYRVAMSFTGLEAHQIESPIRTGHMTEFGGVGGVGNSNVLFPEDTLVKMGLVKQKTL